MVGTNQKFKVATFYIRPEFQETFDDFIELAEKDDRLKPLRYRKHSIFSIAVMQLMVQYVQKNESKLKKNKNAQTIEA